MHARTTVRRYSCLCREVRRWIMLYLRLNHFDMIIEPARFISRLLNGIIMSPFSVLKLQHNLPLRRDGAQAAATIVL